MTSEAEFGALTPTLEGCLGKFQEQASSLEVCPWCSSKGLVYLLCSYPINLTEFVLLCTNPQCLYPLVNRHLDSIFGDLVPVKEQQGIKRKNSHVSQSEDAPSPPPLKCPRSQEDVHAPDMADPPVTEAMALAVSADSLEGVVLRDTRKLTGPGAAQPLEGLTPSRAVCQGQGVLEKSDPILVPMRSPNEPSEGKMPSASDSPLSPEGVLGARTAPAPVFTPDLASKVKSQTPGDILFRQAAGLPHEALCMLCPEPDQFGEPAEEPADNRLPLPPAHDHVTQEPRSLQGQDSTSTPALGETTWVEPEPEASSPNLEPVPDTAPVRSPPPPTETVPLKQVAAAAAAEELVPLPEKLFWRNSDKLCWLDALLVALVNCKSLRDHGPVDGTRKSPTWELIARYDEICAEVRTHQQTDRDGVVRVPQRALENAYSNLHSVRMSVFKRLQPKLKCRLGARETPLFALPVLVAGDPWAEGLFEQCFQWKFECCGCQNVSKTRVIKPLPTFTNLVSDWHPKRATHLAPCNMCHRKDQKRTMVLDSVPPVFALHFVEGLPDGDLEAYAFSRRGRRYAVSTVIQYDQTLKHFVTWTRTQHGMWQEFDDLKHPVCSVHATLPTPPREMHIVFWEEEQSPPPLSGCPPPATATAAAIKTPRISNHKQGLATPPHQSQPLPDEGGGLAGPLAVSTYGGSPQDTSQDFDTSIGSSTLLDAFQGLSSNDIITLTMVEVTDDPPGPPGAGGPDPAQEPTSPADTCRVTSSSPPTKPPPVLVLSDPDSDDNMVGDPTFVPGARKRQPRRRTPATAKSADGPKEKKPRAAPKSRAASRGSKKVVPAPVVPAAVAMEPQPPSAPVPPAASPEKPAMRGPMSLLLSRPPRSQAKAISPVETPAPVRPAPRPAPLPAWRGLAPQLVTPQLRRESSETPQRHAGTYDGFGVSGGKATPAPSSRPLPPPPPPPPYAKSYAALSPGATQLPTGAPPPAGKRGPTAEAPSSTDALRLKLLKKLKAKKKKLAALNHLLQQGDRASPDNTEQTSPQAVTSSTTASNCKSDFFPDWLSPASTASHLSPDSSGLPEVRASGQENILGMSTQGIQPYKLTVSGEILLEELLSGMAPGPPQPQARDAGRLDAGLPEVRANGQEALDFLDGATQGIQPYKLTVSGENLLEELLGQTQTQTNTQTEARDVSQLDVGSTQMCSNEFDSFNLVDLSMFGL